MIELLIEILKERGLVGFWSSISAYTITTVAFFIVYYILFIVFDFIDRALLRNFFKKTNGKIDDTLMETGVVRNLTFLLPSVILILIASSFTSDKFQFLAVKFISIAIEINIFFLISSFLNFLTIVSINWEITKNVPIKSISQVLKVVALLITILIIFSEFTGSVKNIITGLSAVFAALAFVFKDFIMGFVSSIYLSANKVLNLGDWISIPSENVDGEIIEITMQSVKVLNFDKSLSIVPTYNLMQKTYKNWKTMSGLNARRMQVSFNINMSCIKNIDQNFVDDVKSNVHYKEYIKDLEKDNTQTYQTYTTNLVLFKEYIESYLNNHPKITKEMTLTTRFLNPSEIGLPYEIYCFANNADWVIFEEIKSDITIFFVNESKYFGISIYQKTSDKPSS